MIKEYTWKGWTTGCMIKEYTWKGWTSGCVIKEYTWKGWTPGCMIKEPTPGYPSNPSSIIEQIYKQIIVKCFFPSDKAKQMFYDILTCSL